jgi:hypothetical protein
MASLFSGDVRFCRARFATNHVTRFGAWELQVARLVVPKSVGGGNLGRNKLVIRWLPIGKGRSS